VEFVPVTLKINAIWGVEFDDYKTKVWHDTFQNLKVSRLLVAISELAVEMKFPPKPADIMERYDEILMRARKEAEAQERKNLVNFDALEKCYICENIGMVDVPYSPPRGDYTHAVRCSCARGKDLNRWSRYNIIKGLTYYDKESKQHKSAYFNDVEDVLSQDEINLIVEKNKARSATFRFKRGERNDWAGIFKASANGDEPG